MTQSNTSSPILVDLLRPIVLQSELEIYKKICDQRPVNHIQQAIMISVIVKEITDLRDLDHLRLYLIQGDYGLTDETVNRYISDLLFTQTNQYN